MDIVGGTGATAFAAGREGQKKIKIKGKQGQNISWKSHGKNPLKKEKLTIEPYLILTGKGLLKKPRITF